ncbi:MAG: hypothetical protein WDM90_10305 [Ferruginibacter sp.]
MDRNTVIGFVLIGALLIAMFAINSKSNQALHLEQQHIADSIAQVQRTKDSLYKVAHKDDIVKTDSILNAEKQLPNTIKVADTEKLATLENDVLKITFTNKGAHLKQLSLKNLKLLMANPSYYNRAVLIKLNMRLIWGM